MKIENFKPRRWVLQWTRLENHLQDEDGVKNFKRPRRWVLQWARLENSLQDETTERGERTPIQNKAGKLKELDLGDYGNLPTAEEFNFDHRLDLALPKELKRKIYLIKVSMSVHCVAVL